MESVWLKEETYWTGQSERMIFIAIQVTPDGGKIPQEKKKKKIVLKFVGDTSEQTRIRHDKVCNLSGKEGVALYI